MALLGRILRHAFTKPRRVAVIDDRREYTYARLLGATLCVADRIESATSAKHVGIMLPTSGAFPIALLATWMLGRVAVPLNYLLGKDELRYVIEDSDIDTIVTVDPMLEHLEQGVGRDAIPEHINLAKLEDVDFTSFPTPRWPASPHDDELAVLLYTSGTSGKPKGVMLTHGNLESNVDAGIAHAGLTEADAFLGVLPQFHSFGLTALTLIPLRIGSRVIYSARFVPRQITALIRKHKPDIFMAVPSMYGALLSVKNARPEHFASIRLPISGGEPLPDATFEQYQEKLKLKILEGYGLTETSPITHWSTPKRNKRHSVGTSLPNVRTLILDDQLTPQPANTEGEIALAGPNIMAGYYKLPELTGNVIRHITVPDTGETVRAFLTGDIGRVDEEGYLFITGRKKEILIIGGENVAPREIEEVLNKHPAIHAAAVIGKPDAVRGEVPVAFVEVESESAEPFDESQVRGYCREHLAPYKVPREVRVVEELPRSPTGKILRRHLSVE